jgi:IS5 family transposase
VKADLKIKRILKSKTNPAHIDDSQVFEGLVDVQGQTLLADSANQIAEDEAYLIKLNAQELLMRKATRRHRFIPAEQQTNDTSNRLRERVEHLSARMAQMGSDRCRSIGPKRASQHNHQIGSVYNMDRYARMTF